MSEKTSKKVIDIKDRNHSFQKINESISALTGGFYALAIDHGFHIENNFLGNHKIFGLRDNVLYRLSSSVFHCELLLRQHYFIEQRLSDIYKKDPGKILNPVMPKNPLFENAEIQISSIFDSVVFHLSSVYDYMSILINYICVKDRDQTPKWMQITKAARDKINTLSKKSIARTIDRIDRSFAIKLYDYRSELIHRSPDTNNYSFGLRMDTGEFNVKFICSTKLRRNFKAFGEIELDYTVSYFTMWLIDQTIETLAEILIELKKDIESNSCFPFHKFKDKSAFRLVVVDPKTNEAQSPSGMYWDIFRKSFKIT